MKGRMRIGLATASMAIVMATAASSASAWSPAGNYEAAGNLSIQQSTLHYQCNVQLDATLSAGAANSGQVTGAQVSSCSHAVGPCDVSVQPNGLPWSVSGNSSGAVLIDDGDFTVTWGPGCPLSGLTYRMQGDLAASYDDITGTLTLPSNQYALTTISSNSSAMPVGTRHDVRGDLSVFAYDQQTSDYYWPSLD